VIRAVAVVCAGLMAAAAPAFAADNDCDQSDTSQTGMNRCAAKDADVADAELNQVYRQLGNKSEAHEKELLRDAERAWVAFRDKECAYENIADEGGSIYPMSVANCLAEKTRARTKELKNLLACATDDKSCQQ
jgi:uncharacterized protein YecT (DUF1311 family)